MPDPYKWLPESSQKPALLVFFFSSIALLATMHLLDRPLIADTAPRGIVSFELAGSIDQAQKILAAWGWKAEYMLR